MAKPAIGPGKGLSVVTVVATTGSPDGRMVFASPLELAKKNCENRVSRKSRSPMVTFAGSGLGARNPGTTIFGVLKRRGGELVRSELVPFNAARPSECDQASHS